MTRSTLSVTPRTETGNGPNRRLRAAGTVPAVVYTKGKPPVAVSADPKSIVAHLNDLLNTRMGESLSASDFGIVDFADVVHNFPEATQVLQQSIRATILKYEPRLRNVSVHPVASPDTLMIAFEISARLASGAQRGVFRVRTELTPSGKMQVSGR